MSVRLSLICHAALPETRAVGFYRDEAADPAQLALVPLMLPALGRIERIWTATELRARQTAEGLGPGVTTLSALRDCDFGDWQGRTLTEIQASEPEGIMAWLGDVNSAPHGGESLAGVIERAGQFLDAHREPGHTVAVTHPSVIRAAILRSLGAPPSAFWRIDVEPLSLTDLRQNNGRWTLRSHGKIAVQP